MKIFAYYLPAFLLLFLGEACKKDNKSPQGGASLTIVNAVVGSAPLFTNFNGTTPLASYIGGQKLFYGKYSASSNEFSSYVGETHLALFQLPDTNAHSVPLYNLTLNIPMNTIHSLFLVGLVGSPDTLYTVDSPPYHPASDSSVGIRFVNLSPGSDPISINLQGQSNGSEISSLPYKGLTSFKPYPAVYNADHYTFELRNAMTGDLLRTYTMSGVNNGSGTNKNNNSWRYRNFTLALIGNPGSVNTLLINNY